MTRIVRLLAIAAAVWSSCDAIPDTRGVRPHSGERAGAIETFDPKQSAALFVGVRRFPYDKTLAEVRYAVDDAVDLAAMLVLNERVRLIDPARVILALSGEPEKPESQRSLDRLIAAGAQVRPAGHAEILTALDEQMRIAGRNGMLVIALATHGIGEAGTQYLFTATSVLQHLETTLTDTKIRDIASRSDAARSLILIDACRERLTVGQRNSGPDLRSAAPLLRAMAGARGQVVLSAAAPGQFAYEDDSRRNGVFTAAVIDGLRCEAPADERGLVTAETLATFVEERVLSWIRKYRGLDIARATQLISEGRSKDMPLSHCSTSSSAVPPSAVEGTAMDTSADAIARPEPSIDRIPLNARYDITLTGKTPEGQFNLKGTLMVVPCANPDATYIGGEPHPLDLAIRTNASAISSGVRGTIYFFTNSRLTELVDAAEPVKNAAVNVCRVEADGNTGRVTIEMDPEYALGNPLNLMILGNGMLAMGKQILSGTVRLQFHEDGTVDGTIQLSTGRYASAGNLQYEATFAGQRAR